MRAQEQLEFDQQSDIILKDMITALEKLHQRALRSKFLQNQHNLCYIDATV
jgi:hypothetical protein